MTQGIKFLYEFAVGEYDLLTPGSNILSVTSTAAGDHDKKNLTTTALRETWRSANLATQEIVIEANDTTNPIDLFAILNHNLTDDAVITLKANTVNSFAVPAVTLPLTWNDKHIVLSQDLGVAYQYFKLTIQDPGNPCGFIEIGRIVGGRAFTFTQDEDITDDFSVQPDDLAYKMKSEGFFRASNERVQVDRLTIKFDRLDTTTGNDDNYIGLKTMTKTVGETLPFLTIVDPSDVYFQTIWGQLEGLPQRGFTVRRYVSMSMTIQEVY